MLFFDYARDIAACSVAKEGGSRALHILIAWDKLDQCVIDTAVRQWCMHLCVCVKVKSRHFEHQLSQ